MVKALKSNEIFKPLAWEVKPGAPLAPWTYTNPEFFELDYDAFFLRRWQLVGHVNDVQEVGDFLTHDIGRDNVFRTFAGIEPRECWRARARARVSSVARTTVGLTKWMAA